MNPDVHPVKDDLVPVKATLSYDTHVQLAVILAKGKVKNQHHLNIWQTAAQRM